MKKLWSLSCIDIHILFLLFLMKGVNKCNNVQFNSTHNFQYLNTDGTKIVCIVGEGYIFKC